jgi:hypothetical protein
MRQSKNKESMMAKKNNVMAFDVEEMMACDHMHDMYDEQFEVIAELMKTQQHTSLELTRLIVTHVNFAPQAH